MLYEIFFKILLLSDPNGTGQVIDTMLKANPWNALGYSLALAVLAYGWYTSDKRYQKEREYNNEVDNKVLTTLPMIIENLKENKLDPSKIDTMIEELKILRQNQAKQRHRIDLILNSVYKGTGGNPEQIIFPSDND